MSCLALIQKKGRYYFTFYYIKYGELIHCNEKVLVSVQMFKIGKWVDFSFLSEIVPSPKNSFFSHMYNFVIGTIKVV